MFSTFSALFTYYFDLLVRPRICGGRFGMFMTRLASDCPCCAIWRGIVIGILIGACVTWLVKK